MEASLLELDLNFCSRSCSCVDIGRNHSFVIDPDNIIQWSKIVETDSDFESLFVIEELPKSSKSDHGLRQSH